MNNDFLNKSTNYFLVCLALLVTFFTVTGKHGLLHLKQLNNEAANLEGKNLALQSEIISLTNEIQDLQQNSSTLERYARETAGLSRPDEIVYIMSSESK